LPWENTEKTIRSGHRNADEFQTDTLRTITLNAEEGIKAVIGKPKGKHAMEVMSYIFEKDKGWTVEKAKEWFEKHHNPAKEHIYALLPFAIAEKIVEKPLRVRGVAMTTGMSRNLNSYTAEELQAFAAKLASAVFAGLALATVLFLAASATVAAVPSLPAVTAPACAAVGFTCAVGATLSDDLKEEQTKEAEAKSKS
jgi:hypothetical protein